MANNRIKGITIEIGGDTKGLDKALTGVNQKSKALQSELKEVNSALKFNPNNVELLAQKQQLLTESINATTEKLNTLKNAQAQVQRQFESGEIDAEQYRAFQREIQKTESVLQGLGTQMQVMQDTQQRTANATRDLGKVFDLSGKSVEDFSDVIGNGMVRAIKEGRASAAQLETALQQIGQHVTGTETDVNQLRDALRNIGDGGSLDQLRRDLQRVGEEAQDAEKDVSELGDTLKGVAGTLAAGLGIGKAIETALNADDLAAKIDVTFDVPDESKAVVRQALADVKAYGVEGEEALEGLRRQFALNKDASAEANAEITKGAAAISKAYQGIDFIELIQETNEIAAELKTSDKEALNLVNTLLKIGFPPEQLDIIAEYGGQLQRAGYEAEKVKGIMAAAVNTGTWNIDNLLDGLKEGRIVASEMGLGLSNSMKEAVKEAVGNVSKFNEEQIAAMSEGYAQQENELSKTLSKREDALAKSHEKQKRTLSKALDDEYNATSKAFSKIENERSKALDKQYEQVSKTYEKQKDELDKALEQELTAYEKAADAKIALIDKEYTEKLKLIDEERYNKIKSIENEINGINATQDAEDKRQQEKENQRKRAELNEKIRTAKDAKSKQEAAQALRDFEERLRLQKAKDARKAQIDDLKTQKDAINETFADQKDAIKSEYDEKKKKAKELIDSEREVLKERQEAEKKALRESNAERLKSLKENQSAELATLKETNAEKLSALREEHTARKDALSERLSAEQSAVREAHQAELASFKAMNDQKLEMAKNPPDSSAYKAIEQQLMDWGDAIAEGGEKGTKAFEEMVQWLDKMEEGTLKNAIGVGLFGTKWEDQGQHIIDSVLGAEDALKELEKTQTNLADDMSKFDGSGLKDFKQAVEDLIIAFDPLFKILADVLGALARFVSDNPQLVAFILTIASAVGTLVGWFKIILPFTKQVGDTFKILGGVFARFAPTVAGGPIAAIVLGITLLIGLVKLIKNNWEPLGKFFSGLWNGIIGIFKGALKFFTDDIPKILKTVVDDIIKAFKKLPDGIKTIFDGIVSIVKMPINEMIKLLNVFLQGLNKIEIPEWVPKVGGKGFNIPTIPMFAKGTNYFKGGKAIVGENGAELVELPSGSKVHNADKTADMLSSNQQQEITIPITLEIDGAVLARKTVKHTDREMYNRTANKRRGVGLT